MVEWHRIGRGKAASPLLPVAASDGHWPPASGAVFTVGQARCHRANAIAAVHPGASKVTQREGMAGAEACCTSIDSGWRGTLDSGRVDDDWRPTRRRQRDRPSKTNSAQTRVIAAGAEYKRARKQHQQSMWPERIHVCADSAVHQTSGMVRNIATACVRRANGLRRACLAFSNLRARKKKSLPWICKFLDVEYNERQNRNRSEQHKAERNRSPWTAATSTFRASATQPRAQQARLRRAKAMQRRMPQPAAALSASRRGWQRAPACAIASAVVPRAPVPRPSE